MKLSIITINFNNASGLKKTIESVVNQTSKDFEYIIIDGGSNDGSVEIIKEYADKISYWISEPDNGIYHAMNKGIKAAKGEYCQFLNSGDWLVDNRIVEKMLISKPECSIYIGKKVSIDSLGKTTKEENYDEITLFTFYHSTLSHTSAYIERRLFQKYGYYDETLKIVSDWKWYMEVIGIHGELVVMTDIFVSYFDTTGISNTNSTLHKFERRVVLEKTLPVNILRDYDKHYFDIIQMTRLKKYPILYRLIWFFERVLFKIEQKNIYQRYIK